MERGEFTDAVIVAEFQPRHFALELEILRHAANQGVGMDMVARTHFRVVFDDGMRVDAAAIPDDDMLFDDRIRAYFHILADLRPGVHDSGGVDSLGRHVVAHTTRPHDRSRRR